MLQPELASRFARIALGHVTREYPHRLDHALTGPADLVAPRALHPIFFGSFDWHSCVHAYWLLARVSAGNPDLPEATQIARLFEASFTPEKVSAELLMLAAEMSRRGADPNWSVALRPLAEAFAERLRNFLPKATYPVRSGVHSNTAFALALALDYARECHDAELATMVWAAARRWYLNDADCPAWEPGGEDFLSPCLIEAECMRRVLPADEFAAWFAEFLPRLDRQMPRTLFEPVAVSDRTDGRIAHLDGLNLSRAWCWSSLARAFDPLDARGLLMREAAERHLAASLPHIAADYMGEHWLATFALLAAEEEAA